MIFIVAGLLIWGLAHTLKRIAPELRNAMGDRGRGVIAALNLLGLGLMVFGYRTAESIYLWTPPQILMIFNNLLMFVAVYLFAAAGAKTRLARSMRHPMLNGMIVWGIAHLLVNGNGEDLVLFGGLIFWAFLERALINRADPWEVPDRAPITRELRVAIVAVAVYVGIIFFHGWIGPDPFWDGWQVDQALKSLLGRS